jgi:hypothetical protein
MFPHARPASAALALTLAGALSLAGGSLHAQVQPPPAFPIPGLQSLLGAIPNDCPPTPALKAVSGGGVIHLDKSKTTRLPYGVRYRFRHTVPSAEFVLVSLAVQGIAPVSVEAQPTGTGSQCYDAELPELPVGVSVTLTETQGFGVDDATRAGLRQAVNDVLSAFLDILFSGQNAAVYTRADSLRAALDRQLAARGVFTPFEPFRLRNANGAPGLRRLADVVKADFLDRTSAVTDLPGQIREAKDMAAEIQKAGLTCSPSTPQGRRVRAVLAMLNGIPALRAGSPVAPLYTQGRLPLPDTLVNPFAADLGACGEFLDPAGQAQTLQPLTASPVQALFDAAEQAKRVVEESFQLTSTDLYPGVTTTLQRFGQVDVSNAFFGTPDDSRILTTFSFYPGDLRYGGEIQPHEANDRLLVTLGYSVATVTASDDAGAPQGRAYTVGVGFRLTPQLSVGGGRWFSEQKKRGWYVNFSGDLGSIPGLQGLFVRSPNP